MKERLQCAEKAPCRDLCQALGSLGVPVTMNGPCDVPSTLNTTTFAEHATASKNSDLAHELGAALTQTLRHESSHNSRETTDAQSLKQLHDNTLAARFTMWKAMLTAPREGRTFTATEYQYYQKTITGLNKARDEAERDLELAVQERAQAAHDHATLAEHGLVFDSQIIRLTNRLVGNVMDGKPTLLVGDTGTCKTQLAKFVSHLNNPKAQFMFSGHGDMMSGEFMGQTEQNSRTGRFEHRQNGTLPEAMEQGIVGIFDEINIADPRTVLRLQEYLLARPGKRVFIQESGREVQVAPGYAMIATANQASASRYKFRSTFDPAFYDRFDTRAVHYPGIRKHMNPLAQSAYELKRLSYAAAANEEGELTPHIEKAELDMLAHLAYVTQHLYSVNSSDSWLQGPMMDDTKLKLKNAGFPDIAKSTTSHFLDNDPFMTACITPRSLIDTIQRLAPGNKPITFREEVASMIRSLDQGSSTTNQRYAHAIMKFLRFA